MIMHAWMNMDTHAMHACKLSVENRQRNMMHTGHQFLSLGIETEPSVLCFHSQLHGHCHSLPKHQQDLWPFRVYLQLWLLCPAVQCLWWCWRLRRLFRWRILWWVSCLCTVHFTNSSALEDHLTNSTVLCRKKGTWQIIQCVKVTWQTPQCHAGGRAPDKLSSVWRSLDNLPSAGRSLDKLASVGRSLDWPLPTTTI